MKRLFFAISTAVAVIAAQAQTTTRWGVTAGANYNHIHFKQHDIVESDAGFGPVAGVTGEMNFQGIGFGVEGALLYSMRSGKIHYGDRQVWASQGLANETCNMHYLDVPISLKFKYHNLGGLESTVMPVLFAGPDFSFLLGKNLREVNKYKTVSVYIRLGAGVELMERLQLNASYNFSVGETMRTRLLDENVAKNRCWTLTATYFFK